MLVPHIKQCISYKSKSNLCSYFALYQQGGVFNRNTNSLDKALHIFYYNS